MNGSGGKIGFLTTYVDTEKFVIVRRFPDDEYERSRVALIVVRSILLLTTIFLNGISTMTMRRSSQLKSKVCYFVILLQSVVDLGVGVLGVPLFIYYLSSPFVATANCRLATFTLQITLLICGFSIITLSAITVERYIGVLHPYYYKTGVTKKRILIYVSASNLVFCFVFSYRPILLTGMILLFLIFATFVYTKIYLVIQKLLRSKRKPPPKQMEIEIMQRGKLFGKVDKQSLAFLSS